LAPLAVIVGTDHRYQFAGDQRTVAQNTAFTAFLLELCTEHDIRSLTEEMSINALTENHRTSSSIKELADQLCKSHRYCDPSVDERRKAGIVDLGCLDYLQRKERWTDDQYAQRKAEEQLKREKIWVAHLQDLSLWPTLFICGANHVDRLMRLLSEAQIDTVLASPDWDA
jgi:hypothetical protein